MSEKELVIIGKDKIVRSEDAGFAAYVRSIQQFPMLSAQEELEYAKKVFEHHDKEAAKMLIQSHLRLVVKMAQKFKNYGLPMRDLVAEGNLGLMQAVKKFDPHKGFRFSTYSMWWIRAFMQDHVLRSWSMVKIGTTAAQKKLFFNLNKIKKRLGIKESALNSEQVRQIAHDLNVSEQEVSDMSSRLAQSDSSLNAKIGDEEEKEVGDLLASNDENQEEIAIKNQEAKQKSVLFRAAFSTLNEREQDILTRRQLLEEPLTLEELSQIYKISRERIRQIEESAINKIKKEIVKLTEKK